MEPKREPPLHSPKTCLRKEHLAPPATRRATNIATQGRSTPASKPASSLFISPATCTPFPLQPRKTRHQAPHTYSSAPRHRHRQPTGAASPPRIPLGDSNWRLQGSSRLHSHCSTRPKLFQWAASFQQATVRHILSSWSEYRYHRGWAYGSLTHRYLPLHSMKHTSISVRL